ncbi:MAG TPA: band 7 protein [Leptospiraceae bacterium]|mgnify:CR=1 FL=1|nr:band 7 protein [Spirochaetaceae bacterium]HBS03599.1 band 7 protein [Leptospiraceae bacterium]|tara:strand:- start:33577 stop:34665 length:1089 start_codon:yes stop_codon:yes gene_type:complete
MFGFRYLKTRPADYVLLYRGGKIRKEGPGLSFFYFAPSASLVMVPADSRDAPFIFQETLKDFQAVDIQGQVTYRVQDARRLASMLDFTVDPTGRPLGDGLEKLQLRLTNQVQVTLREKIRGFALREALGAGPELVEFVKGRLSEEPVIQELGLSVLDFAILRVSPTPEMARALEATARENLLKEADDAIYQRRNFAVDQERGIKENELQTEIAVEEKQRQIRETQMNAEIAVQEKQKLVEEAKMEAKATVARKNREIEKEELDAKTSLEQKRKELVELESQNRLQQAKTEGQAIRFQMDGLSGLSPELLEVLAANQMDARTLISRAMRDLAGNAEKIGTLNISPDLLQSLLDGSNFHQQNQS